MFFRRGTYSFALGLIMAALASAGGSPGRADRARSIAVVRWGGAGEASRALLHCGMVASYIPQVLKKYRIERVGDEFLDVQGRMLVPRERGDFPAAARWVERKRMLEEANDRYYAISSLIPRFRENQSRETVLHPEVCEEFVDNAKLTDRKACEFVFLVRGCGLLSELDRLNDDIQGGIARSL